ncbi:MULTISPECIES: type VI secretion system baseplate subunit TssG [Paraburkholderia]|uniref:type VI secretion system baseplate subunit TssG n=1 Tax=Paraburkholderia TaxID=1822464 RepID=UPI00225030CF|nr:MULTISPECIES: type VI secretion system baseplate subunit TssG [Paraburkholderia]MCX4171122.1 type VI secretion system baseplate subunit TssG [Paraburkholderia madseniana]MDQ6459134.1 type VI secretion system baseplate subunit TssG [Paraburkholderia madseniana]
MNFFRFCELIELAAPDRPPIGTTDSPEAEPVRFRSRARLGFPSREIDAVEYDLDCPATPPAIRTTFLGLYGVDARMPSYFIDEVAQNREGAGSMSAFLDIFHHRVVTQYYRVWRKYRYPAGFRKSGTDEISRYLLSFAGLGIASPELATVAPQGLPSGVGTRKLLSMLGLASQKTRTAEGLVGVLQHAVPDARITVEEFYPVWISAAGYSQTPLGEECLLGRGFYDCANTVRIVITPQTRESVLGLMPERKNHNEVMALLRFYLGYEARAQLEMHVNPELMPAQALNSNQVILGYTTQLLQPHVQDQPVPATRVQLGAWTGGSNRHATHQHSMH